MFITHIYNKDFDTLRKVKVIGSLSQTISGAKVKVKQIPGATEFAIYKQYELMAFSNGSLTKFQGEKS